MKKHFYAFLALALPLQVLAQPTINNAYSLQIGDELHLRLPSNVAPGPSGHQTWDFSGITDTSGGFVVNVLDDSIGGMQVYTEDVKNVGSTTYMLNGLISGYNPPAMFVKRPLTNGLTDNNSFADTGFIHGQGTSNIEVDGWGTLKTPQHTYNENVLRLKVVINQNDSLGQLPWASHHVYYMWFDDAHAYPVFRIDSIYQPITAPTATTQYLTAEFPVAVKNVNKVASDVKVFIGGNEMLLNANLLTGKAYEVEIMNLNGQKVYGSSFNASGSQERFILNKDLPVGGYVVSIRQQGTANIKVVKTVKL